VGGLRLLAGVPLDIDPLDVDVVGCCRGGSGSFPVLQFTVYFGQFSWPLKTATGACLAFIKTISRNRFGRHGCSCSKQFVLATDIWCRSSHIVQYP
jgi:hypothetical protein